MLTELIQNRHQYIQSMVTGMLKDDDTPGYLRTLATAALPMINKMLDHKIAAQNPIQLENFNRDFDALLDGIAAKDFGMVSMLLERYHVPADGFIERIVVRLMASPLDDEAKTKEVEAVENDN